MTLAYKLNFLAVKPLLWFIIVASDSSGSAPCMSKILYDRLTKQFSVGNATARQTVSIGYFMDQLSPPYRIGAIRMALEDGQAKGLLPGFNFRCVKFVNIRVMNLSYSIHVFDDPKFVKVGYIIHSVISTHTGCRNEHAC